MEINSGGAGLYNCTHLKTDVIFIQLWVLNKSNKLRDVTHTLRDMKTNHALFLLSVQGYTMSQVN